VAPCKSCVNRRFGGMYRFHFQGRRIRERGTSVSTWLQTESPVEKHPAIYEQEGWESGLHGKSIERRREGSVEMGQQVAAKGRNWIMSGGSCSYIVGCLSTLDSVFSHLLKLVPRSRILLPRRWRRYFPPKRRFIQDLHGATSQKTAFFIDTSVKTSNPTKLLNSELK
jgi:hypothetical protein